MRGLGIVAIVACLVVDMATPLCSGAFRLDPTQSTEGVRSRAVAVLAPLVSPPPLRGLEPSHAIPARRPSFGGADRLPRLSVPRVLPRAVLGSAHLDLGSPRSSEDG